MLLLSVWLSSLLNSVLPAALKAMLENSVAEGSVRQNVHFWKQVHWQQTEIKSTVFYIISLIKEITVEGISNRRL